MSDFCPDPPWPTIVSTVVRIPNEQKKERTSLSFFFLFFDGPPMTQLVVKREQRRRKIIDAIFLPDGSPFSISSRGYRDCITTARTRLAAISANVRRYTNNLGYRSFAGMASVNRFREDRERERERGRKKQ